MGLKEGEEGKQVLTDEDITQNLVVFLIAGHETIVGGLTYALKFVGENPNIMAKVVAEVEQMQARKKNKNNNKKEEEEEEEEEQITMDDLKEMKYSRAVVKEALRVSPPIGEAFR